ncbi:hypothetical protein HF295_06160 [Hujiaoplasma nucleasis]|uniref:Uncharacterized protein n=1 Tax=Hujiaoplasma nucleasis TaxID=2725268 RepID=A0A7L6N2R1_9MOLU|nr:hypothetical protein [Hujiaoplasma nucleasis]QLY40453.1 hypothetical protein HF295_06160 [Hujiaoplasma nucleasis]
MKKNTVAWLLELLLMLYIFIFIYENFFGPLYDYGEIKNIFKLLSENIIWISLFIVTGIILICLKVKSSKEKQKIERILFSISCFLWIGLILMTVVLDLSLGQSNALVIIFSGLTTLTFYYGVKLFGITFI